LGVFVLMLGIFAAALAGAGCGGSADEEQGGGPSKPKRAAKVTGDDGAGKPAENLTKIPMGKGVLKGKVSFDGDFKAVMAAAQAEHDKTVQAKPTELDHCVKEAPESDRQQQAWRVDDSGGVKNVFVWLKPMDGSIFEFDDKHPNFAEFKDKTIEMDQPHCDFRPHARVYFPGNKTVKTNAKFEVKNTAKFEHNTNVPKVGVNQLIPQKGMMDLTAQMKPSSSEYRLSCTIHPQMNAVVWVMDNPYFDLSKDNGTFEIKNVPAGKAKLYVWHERAGFIENGKVVDLKDGDNPMDFKVSAK
jgi:hypothetical protein